MRQPRRSIVAALTLSAALLSTAACTGGGGDDGQENADPAVTATTPAWPTAIDPTSTTEPIYVVWTDVVETGEGDTAKLQPTIDSLGTLGYQTLPWDPACQTGAEELLAGLTGFTNPLGVGVVFASAQDAGTFDTLYDGNTISLTPGTYTCGASS
ncbi:hypothetical protein [Cellulomonas xylanilytica]|uniref:Uncharacterized protein n=1 Tax=Cellulomonas xylanilytica TaxID=233583 RepID=A0A510VAA7_9CELL|nr:hypothetical protein [Cellulomonas xylanilytica]GEK22105.1 hypothetical protein CXY01_26250 [Cellulomonas xylanilytica]